MSDPVSTIKKGIRSIAGGGQVASGSTIIGTVVAGSVADSLCDVQPIDGALLKKVRLNADTETFAGIRITPADDSFVAVTLLSVNDAYVSMFSKIEKVEFKDEKGCEVVIEEGKVKLKNTKADLWKQLSDLLDTLAQAIVATPAGTGTFDAATIKKITQVKTNLNNLLC